MLEKYIYGEMKGGRGAQETAEATARRPAGFEEGRRDRVAIELPPGH